MDKYKTISNLIYTGIALWLGWVGKNCFDKNDFCSIICVVVIISAIFFLKERIIDAYLHEVRKLDENNHQHKWREGWRSLNNMPESYNYGKINPKRQIVILSVIIVVSIIYYRNNPEQKEQIQQTNNLEKQDSVINQTKDVNLDTLMLQNQQQHIADSLPNNKMDSINKKVKKQ